MTKNKDGAWQSRLSALPAGWDSYGADLIDPRAITAARRLELTFRSSPYVTPCPNGGVELLWDSEGVYISIDVNPDGSVTDTRGSEHGVMIDIEGDGGST